MPQDDKTTGITPDATTTGRTDGQTPLAPVPAGVPGQPGSEPTRPVNPDPHGAPGATHDTTASKLEDEAATTTENRY